MTETHYEVSGPEGAPVVVLGNSLGTRLSVWEPQLPKLAEEFRVVRFDYRGHGGTPTPAPGPYSIGDLGRDVLDLMDRLGVDRFRYAGLSIGGMIGMWLGAHAPDRVERLVLCFTTARFPEAQPWIDRAALVRREGPGAVAETVVGRWFTPAFASAHPEIPERLKAELSTTDPEAYAGCCEALSTMDLRPELAKIVAPTMVVAAMQDPVAPVAVVAALADGITRARRRIVEDAAHLANVEQPEAVTGLLLEHLL
jgi:3-oxoadipate enol-lactonase